MISRLVDPVDFTPAERLLMRAAQVPFPMETTCTWQSAGDDSTRMTLRNRGEPVGFPWLAANRKDLRKLHAILQAR